MMRRVWVMAALLCAVPALAAAQTHAGVRAGVSGDPDQFVFGAHLETRPVADRVTFRPNVEIGLGDHASLVALNVEFVYTLPVDSAPWRVYVGGGPAANIYGFDQPVSHPGRGDGDDGLKPGFNVLGGVEHRRGFFAEVKVGAIDSPAVKFLVGITFR